MSDYVALLRGINVGGKNMIKMADLKSCLEESGLYEVRTYIQSGNIIFSSNETDTQKLTRTIETEISKKFNLNITTLVISKDQLSRIVKNAPTGWGMKSDWKYNILFLIPPYDISEIINSIGPLKPDIEILKAGEGVLYQALLFTKYGQTTTGKLASLPIYKKMTIRNHNTLQKLYELTNFN